MRLRNLIRACVSVLVAAAGLIGAAPGVRAKDGPTTMLVIDGSGSMWGRLAPDNRAKIDIVRDKLATILQAPSPTRVGLVSFGHRRRGDCSDVELIAPPAVARDGVLEPLAKLNPRGPGPVTAAIKAAVDAIGAARPAQIIVIGDNADNCVPDTCAIAKDIAQSSPGVAIQVIGVGIPAVERPRLICMPEATGGRYYDITDSTGLTAAIDETTKLAILSPDAVAVGASGPTAPPPPAGASFRASASLGPGSSLLAVPLHWRIFRSGEKSAILDRTGADISGKLEAGSYNIEAQLGAVTARQQISVADGDSQSIIVPLGAGHLVVKAGSAATDPASPTAVLTVTAAGKPVAIARNGTIDLFLEPSDYTVTASDGTARVEKTLTLAAGDDKPMSIPLGTGRLEVAASGTAKADDVLFTVFEDDPDSPNGRRRVARSRATQASFTLPGGTYYVSARSGAADVQQRIAVGAGQTVKQTMTLALAPLSVSTLVAGAPAKREQGVFYRIDPLDGDRERIVRAVGPDLSLALPPGRYRVNVALPAFHLTASREVTVTPNTPVTATLDIPSGSVTFRPTAGGGAASSETFWEVADVTGAVVWRATGAEATALLPPGHYTVRLDIRGAHKQAGFDVQAGQTQDVEIGPG